MQSSDFTKNSLSNEDIDGEIFHLVPTAWLIQWMHGEHNNVKKKKDDTKKGQKGDVNSNILVGAIDLTDGEGGADGQGHDTTLPCPVLDQSIVIQDELLIPENVPCLEESSAHFSTSITIPSNEKKRQKIFQNDNAAVTTLSKEEIKGDKDAQVQHCTVAESNKTILKCETVFKNGKLGVSQQGDGDSSLGSLDVAEDNHVARDISITPAAAAAAGVKAEGDTESDCIYFEAVAVNNEHSSHSQDGQNSLTLNSTLKGVQALCNSDTLAMKEFWTADVDSDSHSSLPVNRIDSSKPQDVIPRSGVLQSLNESFDDPNQSDVQMKMDIVIVGDMEDQLKSKSKIKNEKDKEKQREKLKLKEVEKPEVKEKKIKHEVLSEVKTEMEEGKSSAMNEVKDDISGAVQKNACVVCFSDIIPEAVTVTVTVTEAEAEVEARAEAKTERSKVEIEKKTEERTEVEGRLDDTEERMEVEEKMEDLEEKAEGELAGNEHSSGLFCGPIGPYIVPYLCPHYGSSSSSSSGSSSSGGGLRPDSISSFKVLSDSAYRKILSSLSTTSSLLSSSSATTYATSSSAGIGVGTVIPGNGKGVLESVSGTRSQLNNMLGIQLSNCESSSSSRSSSNTSLSEHHAPTLSHRGSHSDTVIDITNANYRCRQCYDQSLAKKSSITSDLNIYDNLIALLEMEVAPDEYDLDTMLVSRSWITALRKHTEGLRRQTVRKKGPGVGAGVGAVPKEGPVLDPSVNGAVVCAHGKLGLRPLHRVVEVIGGAWRAIVKEFPHAIPLPSAGPTSSSGCDRENSDSNTGICDNNTHNNNSDPSFSENNTNAWLCAECQSDKQEDADEFSNQKASRTLEVSDPVLLSLYNTTRGRGGNRLRNAIRGPKKVTVEDSSGNNAVVVPVPVPRPVSAEALKDQNRYCADYVS